MAALALLASSLVAVLLLVVHSWRRRGGRVTAAFFIPAFLFGVLRGNVIHVIILIISGTGEGGKPYLPQSRLLPDIGYASIQVVIGWMFAGYLAWTLSEYVLRRLRGWEGRLFPTVGLAALFMGAISYCMEAAAPRVGWWYWDISTVNPLFGRVPVTGVIAWVSIATDFLFPFLLITGSEYRRRPWRWLTLVVFPVHMTVHALYNTVSYIDNFHVVMILALAGLALFNRTRIETGLVRPRGEGDAGAGARFVEVIPAIAVVTFLAVVLRAEVVAAGDVTLTFTAIPLVVFALLAWRRVPVVVVTVCAAAGLAVWPWFGLRALHAFAPLVVFTAFYSIDRVRRKRAVALAWLAAVVAAAGVFVASEESQRYDMRRYIRLLKEGRRAEAQGYRDVAQDCVDRALKIEFTDPGYLLQRVEFLLMLNQDRLEAVLPAAKEGLRTIIERDPEWATPRAEWVVFLMLDDRLDEAVGEGRTLVALQPGMASHHAVLGYLLLRRGELDEAEEELKAAAALGAVDDATRTNLALVASARARPDTVDLLDIAAPASFSRLAGVLETRGLERAAGGDVASALKLIRRAVHYDPRLAGIRNNYAAMLVRSGAPVEQAIEQCEVAVRLNPRLDATRRNLVRLCLRLAADQTRTGRKDAARATLTRALPHASGPARAEVERLLRQLGPATDDPAL